MLMQLPFIKHNGSEFNVVVLAIPPSSPMLLTRNLLYTAITRAKKLLVVIGGKHLIDFMIQNTNSKKEILDCVINLFHKYK